MKQYILLRFQCKYKFYVRTTRQRMVRIAFPFSGDMRVVSHICLISRVRSPSAMRAPRETLHRWIKASDRCCAQLASRGRYALRCTTACDASRPVRQRSSRLCPRLRLRALAPRNNYLSISAIRLRIVWVSA